MMTPYCPKMASKWTSPHSCFDICMDLPAIWKSVLALTSPFFVVVEIGSLKGFLSGGLISLQGSLKDFFKILPRRC